MKIMCLNGWGGTLHDRLLPFLQAQAPDVLCLQEVVHSPATDKPSLTYRDGDHVLPQRANLFEDVRRVLPDHAAFFCPAAQGVLWDEDVAIPSQWGLATFVHTALPIIGQVQRFVHKTYSPDGYGEHPRSRNAHGVRVHDPDQNRTVSITHMHGLRDLRGKLDTPERERQARKLLQVSEDLAEAGDLKIVCGDFNVRPDSQTLEILEASGLVDLVKTGGFSSTRSSYYKKSEPFADYMLINNPGAVRDFQVLQTPEVSDHRPLVLTL